MKNIEQLKKDFLDWEFSIVVLTSVKTFEGDLINRPSDNRLYYKNLTEMLIKDTLPGILNNAKEEKFEIIIVDNGSEDSHKEAILNFANFYKDTRIVFNNANFGVAPGWNSGLKLARGKYICIVSDDFIVKTPDFLKILQKPMLEDDKVVITGPETAQLGSDGMSRPLWRLPLVDYSAVNCMLIKKDFLEKHGYLDDNFWPYMGEDAEIGWRSNALGYKVVKVDLPESSHWGSSTVYRYWTNEEIDKIWETNRRYLIDKHKKYLDDRVKKDERYK